MVILWHGIGVAVIVMCWTWWYAGNRNLLDSLYFGHLSCFFTILHVVNTVKTILTTDFELSDWNNIVSTCTCAFHTHHECMLWSYHAVLCIAHYLYKTVKSVLEMKI